MQSSHSLIDSLRVFASCDSSSYLSASKNQELVVKKGNASDHYGWAENSLLNPACCGKVPPKNALTKREDKILNLAKSFSDYLGAILPEVKTKDDLNKIDEVKKIILSEINASHLGFETFDRLRPRHIANFNSEVLRIRNWLTDNAAWQCEIAKELVQIRKTLNDHGLSEEDVSIIVKTYCDRAKDKLTSVEVLRQFNAVIESNDDNVPLQRYLTTLLAKTQAKAKPFDWGKLTPPTDPKVTSACADFCILNERLSSSFPMPSYYEETAISLFEGDLEQTCQDLMDMAKFIMDAVHDDLAKWGGEKNLSQAETAALLVKQPGWSKEQGAGTYLYRAFFYLPLAYRMIFNLGEEHKRQNPNLKLVPEDWKERFFQPLSDQHKWRDEYHSSCQRLMDLVGRENLAKADTRFTKWTTSHEVMKFSRVPDSMPT